MATNKRRTRQEDGTYKGDDKTTPDVNEAWEETPVVEHAEPVAEVVTPAEEPKGTEPVNLETEVSTEPTAPAPAASPESLQTDFREKLARKTDNQDVFVPSNPASLEKAAKQIAEEQGFDFNRGTSVGARLLARSQKKV